MLSEHLTNPVLPERLPAESIVYQPGLEDRYLGAREVAFVVHAMADADYEGQWMFIQICVRDNDTTPFSNWHYGFYYRGGDSSWDYWQLDIIHGTQRPTHAAFGAYVDSHLK